MIWSRCRIMDLILTAATWQKILICSFIGDCWNTPYTVLIYHAVFIIQELPDKLKYESDFYSGCCKNETSPFYWNFALEVSVWPVCFFFPLQFPTESHTALVLLTLTCELDCNALFFNISFLSLLIKCPLIFDSNLLISLNDTVIYKPNSYTARVMSYGKYSSNEIHRGFKIRCNSVLSSNALQHHFNWSSPPVSQNLSFFTDSSNSHVKA